MSSRTRKHAQTSTSNSSSLTPSQSSTLFSFKFIPHLMLTLSQIILSTLALLHFPSYKLLDDPVKSLKSTVIILAGVQLLIEAARWTVLLDGGRKIDSDDVDTKISKTSMAKIRYMIKKRQWYFVIAVGITLFGAFFFHIIAVLFGAPLLNKVENTWLFAIYVSLLAIFPSACALRDNGPAWARIFSDNNPVTIPEKSIYYPTVATVVGAWLGAIVIPLDWDRPWQVWPIPCVIGAFLGHIVGNLVALIVCYFNVESTAEKKRIDSIVFCVAIDVDGRLDLDSGLTSNLVLRSGLASHSVLHPNIFDEKALQF
ncbi:8108_t:CDS:2 [Ambispora gerdemannii]|uniref:8108_t:CDS:1 n=1 Tax=Ambispora gerdemannii TaxID=144530 RepID=A0A9N8YMD0_9GLOM|nr:8108_t:CDS:2 [Ambispora gerdemannii]